MVAKQDSYNGVSSSSSPKFVSHSILIKIVAASFHNDRKPHKVTLRHNSQPVRVDLVKGRLVSTSLKPLLFSFFILFVKNLYPPDP